MYGFAGQRPASPFVGRFGRFLVEIGDRAGGDAGVPQDLADVLDAARGHAGQVHLDYGLLNCFLTSSRKSSIAACSSNDAIGLDMARLLAWLIWTLRAC